MPQTPLKKQVSAEPSARKKPGRPRSFDRTQALEKALRLFWRYGYEPVSVASLCSELGINPPSFYAAFENKESLFIEAVLYYEKTYWTAPLTRFEEASGPVMEDLAAFFQEAARILLNPQNPSGCMVVLAAVNISPEAKCIAELVKKLRIETKRFFERRLLKAVASGELKPDADAAALADAFNIFLEGMSVQAKDGLPLEKLERAAACAPLILMPHIQSEDR